MQRISLADVDGTTPGRAALISLRLDPERPATTTDVHIEGENNCLDPWADCAETLAAAGDDFPDRVYSIVGNDRARYLDWKRRMHDLLGGDHSPTDYVEARTS